MKHCIKVAFFVHNYLDDIYTLLSFTNEDTHGNYKIIKILRSLFEVYIYRHNTVQFAS